MKATSNTLVLVAALPAAAVLLSCGTPPPNPETETLQARAQFVIGVCAQGLHVEESDKATVKATLDKGLTSGGLEGAITRTRDLQGANVAKGQDYKDYLDCVEKRLKELRDQKAKEEELCGPKGCLDIVRRADFTKSGCNADGSRRDIAELTNTIKFTKDTKTFTAHAYKEPGTKYDLYYDDGKKMLLLSPQGPSDPNALQHVHWTVPVVDRVVRTKFVAENTNLTDPGVGFAPAGYVMRDIALEVVLPPNVAINPGSMRVRSPATASASCVVADNKVTCAGIMANEEVEVAWQWNMWDRCKGQIG